MSSLRKLSQMPSRVALNYKILLGGSFANWPDTFEESYACVFEPLSVQNPRFNLAKRIDHYFAQTILAG